jgi:hypothetical protein
MPSLWGDNCSVDASMGKPGSKERIRRFLRSRVGKVVTSIEIRDAAGTSVSEWARRVRELREQEGWKIVTHNDVTYLKPGQYVLTEEPPEQTIKFERGISAKLRAKFLTATASPARCAALRQAKLIPPRDVRFGSISDTSRTRALEARSNCRTSVHYARPAIRVPRT